MTWDIEFQGSDATSAWIKVSVAGFGTAYNAVLECGPGVRRTSVGNSSRAALDLYSKPIEGIFRWDADNQAPFAVIAWSDTADGLLVSRKRIALRR